MTIRNLDSLFDPASVAVFGASDRPHRIGATVWRNLRDGGFKGPLYAVNPRLSELDGEPVYASAAALPAVPELAVICTPAATVPALVAELGALGTRAVMLLSVGLDAEHKRALLAAARPHLLRVLGPNSMGLLVPHRGLNASFAQTGAQAGNLAFVSQSGALVSAMLDWAGAHGVGFSNFVSLGEGSDVDVGDLLDFLASDARTRAILLYVESIAAPRKFMSAARAAARNKPVIVVKSGRSASGQRAAATHSGALTGSDAVFDAAIRRAGMLRVDSLQDLFTAAQILSCFGAQQGEQLTILTNGGGPGVMAADAAAHAGLRLAELSAATLDKLDAGLPAGWSRANPVDIVGTATVEHYVHALRTLQEDAAAGTILFIHAPNATVDSSAIASACLPLLRERPHRVVSAWLGAAAVAQARHAFDAAGVPSYDTHEEAVRAFAMLVTYRRTQALLRQAPPSGWHSPGGVPAPAVARARSLIEQVLASGRDSMTEPEAKAVLAAYGVPVVPSRVVAPDAQAAVAAARDIGFPVVLKIVSPDLSHKSDVGGVVLELGSAGAVQEAAQDMLRRVRAARPTARLDGFTVQAMVRRAHAQELIVGASLDPLFGPVILFGQGGTAVEVLGDRALALPPLNEALALELISRTRVAALLAGWRDTPAADRDAIVGVLTAVSLMLADLPQIAELDINPLLANEDGVIALDARIRLSAAAPAGARNFAIRPYPAHLTQTLEWQGQPLTLRPIRPEDEDQHLAFVNQLSLEDVRLRVFYSRRSYERSEMPRLTQIDYAREMAFIAVTHGADGQEQTLGSVRAMIDPDNVEAEFGIIVRSELKGGGLGELLMRKMIDYLRRCGTQRLVATVLKENRRMRDLGRELGFTELPAEIGSDTREIVLQLQTPPTLAATEAKP